MMATSTRHGPRRQRGAVTLLVAGLLLALLALVGLSIDLGSLYVRKTELQNAVDAAALAGARRLDGSAAGLDDAAHGPAGAIALAAANSSDFGRTPVALGEAQLRFGSTPDGPWLDLASAKSNAAAMRFVKVDTEGLPLGTRATSLLAVLDSALAQTTASAMAVAGATVCEGLPMFICTPSAGGFVPGQSYFFGESPGYPVGPGNLGYFDPVPVGAPGLISGANDMRDIVCGGKTYCLAAPATFVSLTQNAFGTLARALNTRFDDYTSLPSSLTPEQCRPDANIKEYPYGSLSPATSPLAWMTPAPDRQSEQDSGATLGVHWAAVPPAGAALAGVPATPSAVYPLSGTPYSQPAGSVFHQPPSAASQPSALTGRRIVTLAIVSNCGAINGSGKPVQVTGFGRFFLPVKAVGTGGKKGIYVEFIETIQALRASGPDIKLFR